MSANTVGPVTLSFRPMPDRLDIPAEEIRAIGLAATSLVAAYYDSLPGSAKRRVEMSLDPAGKVPAPRGYQY